MARPARVTASRMRRWRSLRPASEGGGRAPGSVGRGGPGDVVVVHRHALREAVAAVARGHPLCARAERRAEPRDRGLHDGVVALGVVGAEAPHRAEEVGARADARRERVEQRGGARREGRERFEIAAVFHEEGVAEAVEPAARREADALGDEPEEPRAEERYARPVGDGRERRGHRARVSAARAVRVEPGARAGHARHDGERAEPRGVRLDGRASDAGEGESEGGDLDAQGGVPRVVEPAFGLVEGARGRLPGL